MSYLSFDEKAWDKIRPSAIKKTGVSEALRAFEKKLPKKLEDLATPADCTEAAELLDTVVQKLNLAKARFDKKQHEEAIKKVTGWVSEIGVRRKLITNFGETLTAKIFKLQDEALTRANKAIDPWFQRAMDAKEGAREIISSIQDTAKQAMIAGAKADTVTLKKCQVDGSQFKKAFAQLLVDSKNIYAQAKKQADDFLPNYDTIDQKHKQAHVNTYARCNAIKYKIEDIGYLIQEVNEAHELIMSAGTKSEGMQDKFVKLVAADVSTCEQMAAEAGGSQTSIDIDLKKATEFLDEAAKPTTESSEKTRLVGEAMKRLKEAILNLKRFDGQLSRLGKTLKTKLDNYPDFVTPDNDKFKALFKQIDNLAKIIDEFEGTAKRKFPKQAKSLGERIVQLQN